MYNVIHFWGCIHNVVSIPSLPPTGTVVSTKKEDLVRILDHMDIQVNNPICMLNQDVSRNFLHSSNPKDKYKVLNNVCVCVYM